MQHTDCHHDHAHDHAAHARHGHHHHDEGGGCCGHGGHHHHVPKSFGWRFAIGAGLNMAFVGAELMFGYMTHSLSLLADAVHNFSDVIGLLLAWGAAVLAKKGPTEHHTYGYRGATFLAALANAAMLFIITGALMFEVFQRFHDPQPIAGNTVMIVAAIGILVNVGTALLFWHGQKDDINIRGAFLHMLADAGISLGVVIGAFAYRYTGYMWIDPVLGLLIAGVIIYGSWGLATEALNLTLAAVPKHIHMQEVTAYLRRQPGVTDVHDLHIWAMSTTETAMTAHLVRPEQPVDDQFLNRLSDELLSEFKIHHATIQVEAGNSATGCRLAPSDVV